MKLTDQTPPFHRDNTPDSKVSIQDIEERLSVIYINGLATMSGYTITELKGSEDRHGIDVIIEGVHQGSYPDLHIQLKATYSLGGVIDGAYRHTMCRRHFDMLRERAVHNPAGCLLAVLCLPQQPNKWLETTPDALTMRKCMYWSRPSDWTDPKSESQKSISVPIPETNILEIESLRSLMRQKVEDLQYKTKLVTRDKNMLLGGQGDYEC